MREPESTQDTREVYLEAIIRKALADAWAFGVTQEDAHKMAVQMVHKDFPEEPLSEISKLIQTMRGAVA